MISVVIPVYEQDRYLDACLKSITAQSENDLEIIGIVDGPSNRVVSTFDRWKKKDLRIRYTVTKHAGLGHARSTGFKMARGEYLTFCDSDDTLPAGAYHQLLQTITREKADMVTGNFTRLYDDGKRSLYTVSQATDEQFTAFFEYPMVWNRLFRTKYLRSNGLDFPHVPQNDDLLFMADLYLCRPHCAVVPENVYFWHMHESDEVVRLSESQDAEKFIKLLENFSLFMEKLMPFEPDSVMENLRDSCDFLLHRFRILDSGPIDIAARRFGRFILSLEWEREPECFYKIFHKNLDGLIDMVDGELRYFFSTEEQI